MTIAGEEVRSGSPLQLGGPCLIHRTMDLMSLADQKLSSHQVAPASRRAAASSRPRFRFFPVLLPPTTISKGDFLVRLLLANSASARTSSGLALSPGVAPYFCIIAPSQLTARRMDFSFGQTPTTQIGTRGFWRGRGSMVIFSTL